MLHGHLDVFNIMIQAVGKEMAKVRTNDGSNILHYAIMRKKTSSTLHISFNFICFTFVIKNYTIEFII